MRCQSIRVKCPSNKRARTGEGVNGKNVAWRRPGNSYVYGNDEGPLTACGLKGRSFPRQYGRIVMRLVPTRMMIDLYVFRAINWGFNV